MKGEDTPDQSQGDGGLTALSKFKDIFDVMGKMALGILGVLYVAGLIVVSSHLNQYGIYSLSLLRLIYIMAGVWALLPIFVLSTALIVGAHFIKRSLAPKFIWHRFTKSKGAGDEPNLLAVLLSLSPFLGFVIGLLIAGNYIRTQPVSSGFSLTIIPWAVPISIGILIIYVLSSFVNNEIFKAILMYFSCPILALFIGYLLHFGQFDYSKIPAYLGGGGSSEVQLLIDADEKLVEELNKFGISFQEEVAAAKQKSSSSLADTEQRGVPNQNKESNTSKRRTHAVALILATEEEYIIRGNVIAVSIPRDIVKAVFYKNIYIGWGEEFSSQRR